MALTKQDLKNIGTLMDEKINKAFDTQKQYLDEKLTQEFTAQEKHFDEKLDQIDEKLDQKLDEKVDSLRVLIEDVRSDIKLLAEGREPIIQKQDQHEQKIMNHEKRITTLEDFSYRNRPKV